MKKKLAYGLVLIATLTYFTLWGNIINVNAEDVIPPPKPIISGPRW